MGILKTVKKTIFRAIFGFLWDFFEDELILEVCEIVRENPDSYYCSYKGF